MARSALWPVENGLYHVMNRGHEKRDIVVDDVDRQQDEIRGHVAQSSIFAG